MKPLEGFAHFNNAKELKEFYLEYYSYARKCKSTEVLNKPCSSANLQIIPESVGAAPPKKASKKPDDDDYQEDEDH